MLSKHAEPSHWKRLTPANALHVDVEDLGAANLISDRMDVQTKEHSDKLKEKFSLDDLVGLGLHGDGVPSHYDRTESVQVISMNLPGVGGKFAKMRIPMCAVPSSKVGDETMDAILEVIAWSIKHLQAGAHQECRHDGAPWNASDKLRSKKSGPLELHAALVEVRDDWDFYSKVFHFPYHSELDGICWLCPCKRRQDAIFSHMR